MNIVILHAYSSLNSGDGLLVDLAIEVIRRNFGFEVSITVVASDPESFSHLIYPVFPAPIMASSSLSRLKDAVFVEHSYSGLSKLLSKADLIVGVGGGYMRSKTALEHVKLRLGHAKQLERAISCKVPLVCLPQSIGPFFGKHEKIIKNYSNANAVFVRDDRSKNLFNNIDNIHRSPDLALQSLAKKIIPESNFYKAKKHPETICLVLRKPPAWSSDKKNKYKNNLRSLINNLNAKSKVVYAVQSSVRGNNDELFYRELGIRESMLPLKKALAEFNPDIVVSVRLHGAIESLISGVPAFHISYERKGFGAYEDMGVKDWVVNGADFDVDTVVNTIFRENALLDFKRRVVESCKKIELQSLEMDKIIKGIIK